MVNYVVKSEYILFTRNRKEKFSQFLSYFIKCDSFQHEINYPGHTLLNFTAVVKRQH